MCFTVHWLLVSRFMQNVIKVIFVTQTNDAEVGGSLFRPVFLRIENSSQHSFLLMIQTWFLLYPHLKPLSEAMGPCPI